MDKIEVTQAIEWAHKVASSKPPRYTDASRNAARYILATRTDATPVAVIGKDWSLLWASPEPLSDIVVKTGIEIGSHLYTHPPATDVAALVEAAKASAEGWANVVEFNLMPMQHWQTANDLQRQLRQALTPFTKGQNDG